MGYAPLTEKGILARFWMFLEQELGAGLAALLGMEVDSNEETETYRFLGSSPMMREWVGGRLLQALGKNEYQLRNREYEATLAIDINDIRRDKTGQIELRIRDLARRTAQHWDKLWSAANLAGVTGDCYDGLDFYDASHTEGSSGTQKNLLTASEVTTLDIADADVPTADEMAKILPDLVAYMLGYKDDQGEPINGGAREFLVVVPKEWLGATIHACTADRLSSGEAGRVTGMRTKGFDINVACDPRLTVDTVGYFFRTDGIFKPFILQDEMPVTSEVIGPGSEEEFKNKRWLLGVKANRAVGYGLWQHAIHFTTS